MRLTPFLALVALAGCKTAISTDIYASDVFSVVDTGAPLATAMIIGVGVSSSDGCAKAEANLLEPMKTAYGGAEFIGCEGSGFDTYAQFRVSVEVVYEASNKVSDSAQPIYIGAYGNDAGDSVILEYFMNRESMQAFGDAVPQEFAYYMKEKPEFALSATISNDLASEIEVRVNDVFADGRPIQKGGSYTLARRGEVRLDLSDVSNAAFGTTNTRVFIAEIPRQGQ